MDEQAITFRVCRILPEGNFEETSGIPSVYIKDSDLEAFCDSGFCQEFISKHGPIVGVIKTHDVETKPKPYRTMRSIMGRVDRGGHGK